jgi:hypothetical protein
MKIRHLDDSKHPVNAEHQVLGLPPLERGVTAAAEHPVLLAALWSVLLLTAGCIVYLATVWLNRPESLGLAPAVLHSEAFWWAVAVGLLAQALDGALGTAYGITSTRCLMATGSNPTVASTAVHSAEVFTGGVSGISHITSWVTSAGSSSCGCCCRASPASPWAPGC